MIPRRTTLTRLMLPILLGSLGATVANAQSAAPTSAKPQSIGQEMQSLTAKFNNPDPIVEMDAYNDAFESSNPIIRQMALTSAAASTNPEIRAIAVQGAMAHVKSLVLSFAAPKSAGQSDPSASKLYNLTGGMVTIQIEKFDANDNSFLYVTDDGFKEQNVNSKHFSLGTITGETIQMNISLHAQNNQESCPTILSLKDGKLSGTMTCTGDLTMIRAPVTATIF